MKITISIHLSNLRYVDNLPKNTSMKILISLYNTFSHGIWNMHFVTPWYNGKTYFSHSDFPNNDHYFGLTFRSHTIMTIPFF